MTKALVDTTVLVDVLLKGAPASEKAKHALRRYSATSLPHYAIKELSVGALKNFAWMHNKLVICPTFSDALNALQRMSLTPRRYTTATAIQALQEAAGTIGASNLVGLVAKYGDKASPDVVMRDEYKDILKRKIFTAWLRRRSVTTSVDFPLVCFSEIGPEINRSLIEIPANGCPSGSKCEAAAYLESDQAALEALRSASAADAVKPESQRRAQALKEVLRKGSARFPTKMCRRLGDAMFAFHALADVVILTTNVVDHKPLADALGKQVESVD